MPLFESQERRTRRLFDEAMRAIWEGVAKAPMPATQKTIVSAMFLGGSVAAQTVLESSERLRLVWGKGNRENAGYFGSLYSLAMIPRFYLAIGAEKRLLRDDLTEQMIQVANMLVGWANTDAISGRMIHDYIKLTKQVFHNRSLSVENSDGGPDLEAQYLFGKSLQICGETSKFRCSRVDLPVNSFSEFTERGGVLEACGPTEMLAVLLACNSGAKGMMQIMSQMDNRRWEEGAN